MPDPAPDEEVEGIGRLGVALLDAGYAITDVTHVAKAVARSNSADFTVGALPTGVFVDDGVRPRVLVSTGTSFTFEQVGVVGKLAAEAERGMPWPRQASTTPTPCGPAIRCGSRSSAPD